MNHGMCKHCIYRGDYETCVTIPCWQHESWIGQERKDRIKKLTIVCNTLMGLVDMNAVPDTVKEYINKALEGTK